MSYPVLINGNLCFWDVLLKKVKDKAVSFLLDRIWAKTFLVLKSEVARTMVMGHRTCYFVLLIHTHVTVIKCRRQ